MPAFVPYIFLNFLVTSRHSLISSLVSHPSGLAASFSESQHIRFVNPEASGLTNLADV